MKAKGPPRPRTLADEGYPFPLFEAPLSHADTEEHGPCRACQMQDRLFEAHCYACFRAGKADFAHDTERGIVTSKTATGALIELVRTPTYHSRQGDCWLFCCDRPMIFMGWVDHETLAMWRADLAMTDELIIGRLVPDRDPDKMLHDVLNQRLSIYAFRCNKCENWRGDWQL